MFLKTISKQLIINNYKPNHELEARVRHAYRLHSLMGNLRRLRSFGLLRLITLINYIGNIVTLPDSHFFVLFLNFRSHLYTNFS